MDVIFANNILDRLETDKAYSAGYSGAIVKAFRKRIASIRAAVDERVFYNLKSLHYEKLLGTRDHQRSIRLNDQYRLVIEINADGGRKVVRVVGIEDYH